MNELWPLRSLSKTFVEAFIEGPLRPILDMVKCNDMLSLELRPGSVNIYYRGGSLAKITSSRPGYKCHFDTNYFDTQRGETIREAIQITLPFKILKRSDSEQFVSAVPHIKEAMDCFRTTPKKRAYERQFQQLTVFENNFGPLGAKSDFFICDMEYTNRLTNGTKIDMVAAFWPKESQDQGTGARLALIEMKYGSGAQKGNSGISGHVRSAKSFVENLAAMTCLRTEMTNVMKQKSHLGLFDHFPAMSSFHFSDEIPLYIFLIANHEPCAKDLENEIKSLPQVKGMAIRFVASNFCGYALFKERVYNEETFVDRFLRF